MSASPPAKPDPETRAGVGTAAFLWEAIGLLVAVAIGALVLLPLYGQVRAARLVIEREKAEAAAKRRARAIPVIVQVLEPSEVTDRIDLPGRIQAIREVVVSTHNKGQVTSLPVAEGDLVKAGDPVCLIDERDYRIALQAAQARLTLAQRNYEKTRKLVARKIENQATLDRDTAAFYEARALADRAKLDLERCTIRSSIGGVVNEIVPEPGEFLAAEKKVAVILDTSRVKVEVGIPEQDVDAVRGVATCTLLIDAVAGGLEVEGKVTFLSHATIEGALVYLLRLEVPNADGRLRPGMFATARIVKARRPGAIKVPLFSILARGDEHLAYVVDEAVEAGQTTTARERAVKIGIMQGRSVEITRGLAPGDRLVVLGQRAVSDGAKVAVMKIVRKMGELAR